MQLFNAKFSGSVIAAAKGKCWEELAREVSAVSAITRTGEKVKKKWRHGEGFSGRYWQRNMFNKGVKMRQRHDGLKGDFSSNKSL